LEEALSSDGKTELARKILSLEIQNCTFSDELDVGYVYSAHPPYAVTEAHKEAATVKETLALGSPYDIKILTHPSHSRQKSVVAYSR